MSIIEGIGDEVLYTFIVILVSIVFVLAWLSTYVNTRNFSYVVLVDNDIFTSMRTRLHNIVLRNYAPNTPIQSQQTANSLNPTSPYILLPSSDPTPSPNPPSASESSSSSSHSLLSTSSNTSSSDVPSDVLQEPVETSSNSIVKELTRSTKTQRTDQSVNEPIQSISDVKEISNDISNNGNTNKLTEDSAENINEPMQSDIPADHIQVRLQYIDGNQRIVHAHPDETIGEFKRRNFSAELSCHSTVRFIMSGQELKNESMSLRSYKVFDNNIIHCLVSTPQPAPSSSSSSSSTNNAVHNRGLHDIGSLAFPLFGLALGALWYARIFYRGYFNGTSTLSLLAITFLYGLSFVASLRNTSADNHAHLHRD